jgi:hypothetical protein
MTYNTRREFLRISAMMGAGLVLGGCEKKRRHRDQRFEARNEV